MRCNFVYPSKPNSNADANSFSPPGKQNAGNVLANIAKDSVTETVRTAEAEGQQHQTAQADKLAGFGLGSDTRPTATVITVETQQDAPPKTTKPTAEIDDTSSDEDEDDGNPMLKELKKLLDDGKITQSDYDNSAKRILAMGMGQA